jgi:hypothetical protein
MCNSGAQSWLNMISTFQEKHIVAVYIQFQVVELEPRKNNPLVLLETVYPLQLTSPVSKDLLCPWAKHLSTSPDSTPLAVCLSCTSMLSLRACLSKS